MIAFLLRRFRWVLLGAGAKWLARRGLGNSVNQAATELEDRLPQSVAKLANALPGDVLRVGGTAAVAGRAAKRTGMLAVRGGSVAARTSAAVAKSGSAAAHLVPSTKQRFGARAAAAKRAWQDETEAARKELASDYARHVDGDEAGLETLLDRRDVEAQPLPMVQTAVNPGRRRFRRPPPAPEVPRMQRSYRRPEKAWDRPRFGR